MAHFPETNPLGKSSEPMACTFPNCTYARAVTKNMRPFFTVCEAADTVMHHFADAHFNEDGLRKMIAAMEPLRVALIAAGYGGAPQEPAEAVTYE